jgi:hypothetical protein
MPLPLRSQHRIHTAEMKITLRGNPCHVIEGMAQAGVTPAPHYHLSALATLLRDRGDPALRAQDLIVPFSQRLGGFSKQPSRDLATNPRQGLHNRHIRWPPSLVAFLSQGVQ